MCSYRTEETAERLCISQERQLTQGQLGGAICWHSHRLLGGAGRSEIAAGSQRRDHRVQGAECGHGLHIGHPDGQW